MVGDGKVLSLGRLLNDAAQLSLEFANPDFGCGGGHPVLLATNAIRGHVTTW
jgi:hypothetical protein